MDKDEKAILDDLSKSLTDKGWESHVIDGGVGVTSLGTITYKDGWFWWNYTDSRCAPRQIAHVTDPTYCELLIAEASVARFLKLTLNKKGLM